MAMIFGGQACTDPASLATELAARGLPIDHWRQKAGLFRLDIGRSPGRGWLLLTKAALDSLDLTADHDLVISGSDRNHVRTLSPITLLHIECITPGSSTDSTAVYLCEVVDRRHLLGMIPLDKGFNVRTPDGTTYFAETLNAGVAWTWQQVVTDLATTLGIGTLTLPFTPHGTPETLVYRAPASAWGALCDVLDRLACAVKYNPEGNTFSVVRLGVDDSTALATATALQGDRLWDGYCSEPNRGWRPETVRVIFLRFPVPISTDKIYFKDITLAAATGVKAGTCVQLVDDMIALGRTGDPSNKATLDLRAQERADDWLRKRTGFDNRFVRSYRDFQSGSNLLGSTCSTVFYDDRGGPFATVLRSEPDDRLEQWQATAGRLMPWGFPGSLWKDPVRVATTGALAANTYANGTNGAGATLTADANGALAAQDGVTLVAGDSLLVKDEASELKKGIYTVTQVGTAGAPYILTRRTDADSAADLLGAAVAVLEGTVNADTVWLGTANETITVGTTALPWVKIGPLWVEAADGSPSYKGIGTLQFDEADGFVVTNPSSGVARIDFALGTALPGALATCAWVAGLATTDCLRMTIPTATGQCADIDTDQVIYLEWDGGDSRWESGASDFTGSGSGGTGQVVFGKTNGVPYAQIDGVYGTPLGCDGSGLYLFAFGGDVLCGDTPGDCNNSFVVGFECVECPVEEEFTTPGADTFTPDASGDYLVECWGGGGSGHSPVAGAGGGGGGGGAYSASVLALTGGTPYSLAVGAGGSSGAGGTSQFNTSAVVAIGGDPGSSMGGGNGGTAASGTGTTKFSGGNGAAGTASDGGGGGSSAGSAGNGNNGSGTTGGAAPTGGGAGGNGGTGGGNGANGNAPGGGAGGGDDGTTTGGNGANGKVRITGPL